MSTDPIHALVEDFSNQLRAEVQRQAVAALSGTFNHAAPLRNGKVAPRAVTRSSDSKGAKRDPALIKALSDKFVAFVKGHEGMRIEQIHKELGTNTKELALPIRKLLAEKRIKTRGQKRSTTYFAGSGGSNGHSNDKAAAPAKSARKGDLSMTKTAIASRKRREAKARS